MPRRRLLRPLLTLALAILLFPATAPPSARAEKKAGPTKVIRVAILPFVNSSAEIGATKIMGDLMAEQVKRIDKSRVTYLLPQDVERILTDLDKVGVVHQIADRWATNSTLDSTAIGGLDSLLMVDAVLIVKISEWESHRVPVIGSGPSNSTVGLAMAIFDIRTKARIWSKNPREQRFAAEQDVSSSHVNYDETGFIQRSSDSAPPRIEAVASDLVRDALKTFPPK